MAKSFSKVITSNLLTLLKDYRDFNSTPIESQPVPNAVTFARQVSKGYPAIHKAYNKKVASNGAVDAQVDPSLLPFPAIEWTRKDLTGLVEDKIDVAVTPNGRADDLHRSPETGESTFLSPATTQMTIADLISKLEIQHADRTSRPVYYLQSQNSNLTTTELRPILKQVPENFPFAEPVLGIPEAINIWIGDERSVTSTHRDPYENLYLVLKGSKTFTLYPPVDEITLPTEVVRTGHYNFNDQDGTFSISLDESDGNGEQNPPRIPWVSIDPLQPREKLVAQYPMYSHSSPRQVTVHEGEMLYLPSGWYHHVQQQCGKWEDGSWAPCIAVNYWYDMEYDGEKYIMRQLVGRLVAETNGRDDEFSEHQA